MRSPDPLRRPFGALLAEQVRAVGFALVREAALAGAALAVICIFSLLLALRHDEQLDLIPDLLLPTLLVALLLPFGVWKGDPAFGRAYLWTLPVRRQHAAVAKVLAGALWLMLAMLVTIASLSLVALASGGGVGAQEVRFVEAGAGGMRTATRVAWSTPFWMWLMPFASALVFYLASSAAVLGLRHPVRWLAGFAVAVPLLFVLILGLAPHSALEGALTQLHRAVVSGRFGFDAMVSGGENSLVRAIERPGPGHDLLWSALPGFGRWATATLIWFTAALVALALAIRRHWER